MDQAHRSVVVLALLLSFSCGGNGDDDAAPAAESTCKPFAKPAPLAIATKPADGAPVLVTATSFVAGDVTYATKASAGGVAVERTAAGQTTVIADGFVAPQSIFFDSVTGDLWLVDREGGADVAHRIRSNVPRPNAPGFFLPSRIDAAAVVVRDGRSPNLEGRLVYSSKGSLVVVDPFGPAGPPIATSHPFTGGTLVGISAGGSAVAKSPDDSFTVIEDSSASSAPKTLSATGCLDPNAAVPYDVASPLWSDGAEKQRAVVLPSGTQARVLPDGDLKFPVGTVAIKTFSRGGKKVETRLFIQHALLEQVPEKVFKRSAGDVVELKHLLVLNSQWCYTCQ